MRTGRSTRARVARDIHANGITPGIAALTPDAAFDATFDPVIIYDRDGRYVYVNPAAERFLCAAKSTLVGKPFLDAFPVPPAAAFQEAFAKVSHGGGPIEFEAFSMQLGRWYECRQFLAGDLIVAFFRDVSERKSTAEQLALIKAAVESANDMVIITDAVRTENGLPTIVYANAPVTHITGWSPEELVGKTMARFFGPATDPEIVKRVVDAIGREESNRFELMTHRKDGSTFWVESSSRPVRDAKGVATHWVIIRRDITERKLAEKQLAHLAHHDALTGLPNRTLLLERLSHSLTFEQRNRRTVAVLYLDLDRFKIINDTLGHAVGDELLKVVSGRLERSVRPSDTLARPGGDEFIIVLADVAYERDVQVVAEKLIKTFSEPFRVAGDDFFISTSIGVSIYPRDGSDVDTLIKNADAAMYSAKERGRNNVQYYVSDLQEATLRKLALESDLRKAIETREFVVHYQPIIALSSGFITGMEALVRWQHPHKGLIMPADFIPLAEESGLIVPLGEWVLSTACAQQKEWERLGLPCGRVTVNISARQFQQRELPELIERMLRDHRITRGALELELTESVVMRDVQSSMRALAHLRDLGVGVAMDDFGTGYSSLSYLKHFPIAALKIDRSFVDDLTVDPFDDAISSAIVNLAKSLNIRVTAEGVESHAQLQALRRLGCDEAQGWYFSPAVAAADSVALFERFKPHQS